MSDSEVVAVSVDVHTLADLLDKLKHYSNHELHTVDNDHVYVFGHDGCALHLRVIVDKLTDGSVVYNINIE